MRQFTERTGPQELAETVRLGLIRQERCLISVTRIEQCLTEMDEAQRAEWLEGFCRAEHLSAETVDRGVLFGRVAAQDGETAARRAERRVGQGRDI